MAETRARVAHPPVRVGQVWADNDPRSKGRTVRVLAVANDRATCKVLTDIEDPAQRTRSAVGKITRISLRRLRPTSTGYTLIEDVAEATTKHP
jgi:hypothetical protein